MKKYITMVMVALVFTLAISAGGVIDQGDDDAALTGIGSRVCGDINGGGWDIEIGTPPPTHGVASFCAYLYNTGALW